MRTLTALGVALLMVGMSVATPALAEDRDGNQNLRDRFVGAWRLARLEEPGADGKIHRADCTGLLVFTRDGHMSVQVMYRNPPEAAPASPSSAANPAPVQYAQGGYEASFGTYRIDEADHTFTYHVDGALVRTLIGKICHAPSSSRANNSS